MIKNIIPYNLSFFFKHTMIGLSKGDSLLYNYLMTGQKVFTALAEIIGATD